MKVYEFGRLAAFRAVCIRSRAVAQYPEAMQLLPWQHPDPLVRSGRGGKIMPRMMSNAFKALAKCLIAVVLLFNASGQRSQTPGGERLAASDRDKQRLARFEKKADELRARLKIPGTSAVIVKDRKVLWAKGFGFADLENRIPAAPDTLYHVASLTKTFAATLLMQLVEKGKLDLDEPMSHYSSDFKDDSVKVKHLLSHTSEGKPGERYQYNGNRYDYLTAVIEKKTGRPFRAMMVETFLDPLAMASSVPGHDVVDEVEKWGPLLGKDNLSRYAKSLARLSQPYTLYGDSETVHVPYPPKGLGASAGLLSTVLDMAKYDAAMDRHLFLKTETREKAWTAFVSNGGRRLPHGLGWFVTDYGGIRLIWHYGHWGTGFSAIYLKVPERQLSLIMLANSEALSDHQFQVGDDITNNVFACSFLRLFVFEDARGRRLPDCEGHSQTALRKWTEHRRSQARVAIRLSPGILESYVGQYQFEPPANRVITVSREGSRLFVDIPRDHKSELFAESESKFFLKVRPVQLTFIKEEGQVAQVEYVSFGQTSRGKRVSMATSGASSDEHDPNCLEKTTLRVGNQDLFFTVQDAERIRQTVETYLAKEKPKLEPSVTGPGPAFIDCMGTIRMGRWILGAGRSATPELRLTYRVHQNDLILLQHVIELKQVAGQWKVADVGLETYHSPR